MRAAELQRKSEEPGDAEPGDETYDPVCGRPLRARAPTTLRLEHQGATFHFCSEGCRDRFEQLAERVRIGETLKMGALFAAGERVRWGVA